MFRTVDIIIIIIIIRIIIIVVVVLVITFMHGIHNYTPETNHVSRVYSTMLQLLCIHNLCYM
jgi:flagellar basal body-associated protein FliL